MSVREPFVLPPMPEGFVTHADTPSGWLDGYIQHFSPSSLRMLKICPEQYRQRYILGRKQRPGEALTLGSAVHKAVAYSHEKKISSGEDLPVLEVIEFFHDKAWPDKVKEDGGVDEIRWDNKPDEVRHDGERMTRGYHTVVSPRIQPVKVEQRIEYLIDGVAVPIIGYIDVEEAGNNIDVKTGKQVQRKPDAHWFTQGSIYTAFNGKPTHFHSVSRAKVPSIATPLENGDQMVVSPHPMQKNEIETVIRDFSWQLEYFFNRYGPDEAWPTTGIFMDYKGGPACNYCGFRKYCPAWAHERQVVPEVPTHGIA